MAAKIGKNKTKATGKTVKKTTKLQKPTKKVTKTTTAKKATTNTSASYKLKKKVVKTKAKLSPKVKHKITAKPIAKAVTKTAVKTVVKSTKKISKKPAKSTVTKKIQPTPVAKIKNKIQAKPKTKVKLTTNAPIATPTANIKQKSLIKTSVNYDHDHASSEPISEAAALSGPGKFQPYHIHVSEEYMNEQQLKHFKNILEAWKQELMVEVDNTITEMKEADILADPNDRATQEETFNLELRTRDRERKLIKKIEAALTKISEQNYGYCDTCGIEIGVRRLEARPTATLCIECKTLAEIREKRS